MSARRTDSFRAVAIGVALIALATLLYEVLLTRIFSVTLWYHFGFLAISLALLGTAAAAVLCFLYPERLAGDSYLEHLRRSALLFALGLMSKSMLVTLPFALLLFDVWPLARARGWTWNAWRPLVLEKLPFFGLSLATGVAALLTQRRRG